MPHSDVIIIGAGASGLMAGIAASSNKAGVTILEKMPRGGRKIMITGKGRCNFSNIKPWDEFSPHIKAGGSFLKKAFFNFPPDKVIDFFERNGLETVVERGDRAFPESHKAVDVVDTLVNAAFRSGCAVETGVEVKRIFAGGSPQEPIFTVTTGSTTVYTSKRIIVATGGLSYPGTGSTGDGYAWADFFGHKIKKTFPSLTAIVPEGYKRTKAEKDGHIPRSSHMTDFGESLCGIQLKNVGITLYSDGKIIQEEFGDVEFTDGGLEGAKGFAISRNCVKAIQNGSKVKVAIDLKNAVPEDELSERVRSLWDSVQKDSRSENLNTRGKAKVLLGKLIPRELIHCFLQSNPKILTGAPGKEVLNLQALTAALKDWEMKIAGYVGYERCVVTAGGVSTDEINPKTMESKLQKGLYFCGEVLDIDGDTGGYNLQAAFCTGRLAGESAAESVLSSQNASQGVR